MTTIKIISFIRGIAQKSFLGGANFCNSFSTVFHRRNVWEVFWFPRENDTNSTRLFIMSSYTNMINVITRSRVDSRVTIDRCDDVESQTVAIRSEFPTPCRGCDPWFKC